MLLLDEITCNSSSLLQLFVIIKNILKIISIVTPILLIISSMLDIIHTITSAKADLSKLWKKLLGKIVAAAFVFFVPNIVNITMDAIDGIKLTDQKCWGEATNENVVILRKKEEASRIIKEEEEKKEIDKSLTEQRGTPIGTFKLEKYRVLLVHSDRGQIPKQYKKYTISITDKKGKKINANNFRFTSENPAIAYVTSRGVITAKFGGTTNITVTDRADSENKRTIEVVVLNSTYINAKLTTSVSAKNLVTGKTEVLPSGTKGVYNGVASKGKRYTIGNTLKVGNNYYAVRPNIIKATSYHIYKPYPNSLMEEFVNTYDIKSNTKYLFWTAHGVQTQYMFIKSRGKWKVHRTAGTNTGDILGLVHKECDKPRGCGTGEYWNTYVVGPKLDENNGAGYVIYKGKHSNPWHKWYTGRRYPGSHGCTRIPDDYLAYVLSIHSKIKGSKIIEF